MAIRLAHLMALTFCWSLLSLTGCTKGPESDVAMVANPSSTSPRDMKDDSPPAPPQSAEQLPKTDPSTPPPPATSDPNPSPLPSEKPSTTEPPPTQEETVDETPLPLDPNLKPLNKNKTLFFEKAADGTRRVYIDAHVCLREGPIEVLLCRKGTKEHESILHADIDAREVHLALLAAGATPGKPVQFFPEYVPAHGTTIQVSLQYRHQGQIVTVPAKEWIWNFRQKKTMEHDWVFAGSRFLANPDNPKEPPVYTANNGEVICVANFVDAMLDLPIKSSREQAELTFEANTRRIPPVKSPVRVILQPALKK